MLKKNCVLYIFAFSLPHMPIMGKTHSNFSLCKIYCKGGGFLSKELLIFFCVIVIWWPVGFVGERLI